jgi:hypothetical protein
MSQRKTELEAHFWKLFVDLDATLFKLMAGVNDTKYAELAKYHQGSRKTRPVKQADLLAMREDLLDRLDDYERDNDLGVTV